MDTQNTSSAIRPKIGRVPALPPLEAPAVPRVVAPRRRNLYRPLMALSFMMMFIGVAALSVKSGSGVSVSEAIASTFNHEQQPARDASSRVHIQEETGTIVGQLTKIAPETEQVVEIKTASTNGKSPREDLLSIVGSSN